MRYRVYGLDGVSNAPRKPIEIEADTEESARSIAKQMGMAVKEIEPMQVQVRGKPSIWLRWLHGVALSIWASCLLGILWQVPAFFDVFKGTKGTMPAWLEMTLSVIWGIAMLLFCPLAFEWMARKLWSSILGSGSPQGSESVGATGPGLAANFNTGVFSHDLLLMNASASDLTEVDLAVTLYEEDGRKEAGQKPIVKQFYSTWKKDEIKTINVPSNRYQKVVLEGSCIQGSDKRINYDWTWTWGR